jgi:hypothetical protein
MHRYVHGHEQHSPIVLNVADIDLVLSSGCTRRESVVTAGTESGDRYRAAFPGIGRWSVGVENSGG